MGRMLQMFALGVCFAATVSCAASAQSFPVKPVRTIVPFPPGGAADLIGRAIAHE